MSSISNQRFIRIADCTRWPSKRARFLFRESRQRASDGDEALTASQSHGVISQKRYMELSGNRVTLALAGTDSFLHVDRDDFVISLRTFEGGIERAHDAGCISPAYTVMKPSSEVLPTYYHYLLKSRSFISGLQTTVTGIRDGKTVRFDNFSDLILPVPAHTDQQAIADFLDRETARIDQLIEKKQRLVALIKENEAAKLETLTFAHPEADKFEHYPFKWACRIPQGQVDPTDDAWKSKPLIAPNHIESKTGRLLYLESEEEQGAISGKYAFPKGTVVYSKIRPALAKACISPTAGLCSADMYPIIPFKKLLPEFLLMQLLTYSFTDWAVLESMRVAMPKINRETIGTIKLIVPPLDIQKELISSHEKSRELAEATIDKTNQSIDRLREFRSALITAAVTGQIDVNEWSRRSHSDERLDAIAKEMEA